MAIPVWSVGQVLAASDVNNWFVPIVAYKASPTARTSTTLTVDPDLQISLAANAVYAVNAAIIHQTTGGSSGFDFAWTFPSSATGGYATAYTQAGPTTNGWGHGFDGSFVTVAGSDNLVHGVNLFGTLFTVSSGTLGVIWSAATASAGTVTVLQNSLLMARRIG